MIFVLLIGKLEETYTLILYKIHTKRKIKKGSQIGLTKHLVCF